MAVLATSGLVAGTDWPVYGGDPGNTKYSTLKQINRSNVTQLKVAWVYHTGDISDGTKYPVRSAFEATPLVVDGVMYVTTPFSRVIALDPETGRELWAFDPKIRSRWIRRATCSSVAARLLGRTDNRSESS
jgi:quinoprotein glucose dehydrogenase